jgi:hypothetical protein
LRLAKNEREKEKAGFLDRITGFAKMTQSFSQHAFCGKAFSRSELL